MITTFGGPGSGPRKGGGSHKQNPYSRGTPRAKKYDKARKAGMNHRKADEFARGKKGNADALVNTWGNENYSEGKIAYLNLKAKILAEARGYR